jgi:hypothetical protein
MWSSRGLATVAASRMQRPELENHSVMTLHAGALLAVGVGVDVSEIAEIPVEALETAVEETALVFSG